MITPVTGHSAIVTMELHAGDLRVPLAQLAHNFAIPVQAVDLPTGAALIEMTIDGKIARIPVLLGEGVQATRRGIVLSSIT